MAYDPQGSGAAPDDPLVRRGVSWESAKRLVTHAARAKQAGVAVNGVPYGHGLSVTSPEANRQIARDPNNAVQATRKAFEQAGFEVRYTPTTHDSDHHTIQLPKPVTRNVVIQFNTTLGRTRRGP